MPLALQSEDRAAIKVITVRVSDGVEASLELISFIRDVVEAEGLSHWPVHIWGCFGEGVCGEAIRFGLCKSEQKTRELFLHEVAHALLNPKRSARAIDWHKDSYWHKGAWQTEFKRLCHTYLIEE